MKFECARQAPKDLRIRQRIAERLHHLDLRGQRQMKIGGDQIVEFQKTRRGQHVIGQRRGIRRKQVEHHGQQILALERTAQASLLRTGGQRIHVPHE